MAMGNHINDRFVQKKSKGDRTLWVKYGFSLKNGQPIKLTTHGARHWLSTMAESDPKRSITFTFFLYKAIVYVIYGWDTK
jgi:hypothetical protein